MAIKPVSDTSDSDAARKAQRAAERKAEEAQQDEEEIQAEAARDERSNGKGNNVDEVA